MRRPIDSHKWASKIELRRLLSGKPDLKIKADPRKANYGPPLPVKSVPVDFNPRPREGGDVKSCHFSRTE